MAIPVVPILAQLITLGVGDRTEGRRVIEESAKYYEASTSPGASLDFRWRRASLTFGYSPSITVTPLEREPREVDVFHSFFLTGNYRLKHTTLSLSQSVGFGDRDFRSEAIATGTTPPDSQTPPPSNPNGPMTGPDDPAGPNTLRATDETVRFRTLRTQASLDQELSSRSSLGASVGYTHAGGTDSRSRTLYPVVEGPDSRLTFTYQLTRDDTLDTTFGAAVWSSDVGTRTWLFDLSESWSHDFSTRTSSELGAGISYSNGELENGLVLHSIYPTGHASISHSTRLGRGDLSMSFGVGAAPTLDLNTAVVDPRLTTLASIGWGQDRFSLDLGVSSAVSLDESLAGALNSFTASLTASYELGAGFSADAGVRGAWQTFQGATAIPPTLAFFVGVSWGAAVPLVR